MGRRGERGNPDDKGSFYRTLLAVIPTEGWFFVAGRARSVWKVSSLLSRKRKNYIDSVASEAFQKYSTQIMPKWHTLGGIVCCLLVICFQTSWFLYLVTGLALLREGGHNYLECHLLTLTCGKMKEKDGSLVLLCD